ncbi:MAG: alpha/beta fold hydrolase [Pseudomonadota bacterium]
MTQESAGWLAIPRPNPWAELRLICLPYAGGTTATYLPWQHSLPQQVELIAVQPPGRGNRLGETGFHCVEALVEALYPELKPHLEQPYVLFGHSMGARIGYALVRHLQSRGDDLPAHFIASASPAPHVLRDDNVDLRSDEKFIEYLRELGGTPPEVLANKAIMNFYLPHLRADFAVASKYYEAPNERLEIPLSIMAGNRDEQVPVDEVVAWRDVFRLGGELSTLDGGHMFIESAREAVVARLNRILQETLALLACDGFSTYRSA